MCFTVVCEINCQWIAGDKVDAHQSVGENCVNSELIGALCICVTVLIEIMCCPGCSFVVYVNVVFCLKINSFSRVSWLFISFSAH